MPSKANIYGHPIHPMLVAFPIVFFIMAFVADVFVSAGLILLVGGRQKTPHKTYAKTSYPQPPATRQSTKKKKSTKCHELCILLRYCFPHSSSHYTKMCQVSLPLPPSHCNPIQPLLPPPTRTQHHHPVSTSESEAFSSGGLRFHVSDWSQFAYILLIGGIATAIAAAITGLIEYSIIKYVLLLSIFVASKCFGIILYVFGACFPEFHVAAKVTHIHLSLLFFQIQPKRG